MFILLNSYRTIVIWLWLVVITCPRTDSSFTKYVRKRVMLWSYKLIYVSFYRATASHFGMIFLHQEQISYTSQLEYEEKFKWTNQNLKQICAAGLKGGKTPATLPAQNTLKNVLCFGPKNWYILAIIDLLPAIFGWLWYIKNNIPVITPAH